MQTNAAVVRELNCLTIETLGLDPPRANEVLVRVRAAGVCHSDLHTLRGTSHDSAARPGTRRRGNR